MISYQFRAKGTTDGELGDLAAAAVREAQRRMGAGAGRAAPAEAAEASAEPEAPPAAPAPASGAPPPPPPPPGGPGQQIVSNLMAHIPSEAVALSTSLGPLVHGATQEVVLPRAWLVLVGSLALTVLVRWLNNASMGVWVTSLLAFGLWMCLVPDGALQATFKPIALLQVEILMATGIFSAIVTALATYGRLK